MDYFSQEQQSKLYQSERLKKKKKKSHSNFLNDWKSFKSFKKGFEFRLNASFEIILQILQLCLKKKGKKSKP